MQTLNEIANYGKSLRSEDGKLCPSWSLYLEFGHEYFIGCGIQNNPDGTATYPIWNKDTPFPTDEELQQYRTFWNTEVNLCLLRKERNVRLAETDYWTLGDTAEITADQLAYRQALRNITDTYTSIDDVVWPVKPA